MEIVKSFSWFICGIYLMSGVEAKVSVVIPSYGEPRLLLHTLEKLTSTEGCDREIIVVVDEPSKEYLNKLRKYDSKIKLIVNEKRRGKVAAYKTALKIAGGDYIIFLDDDVEVKSDNFVQALVEALQEIDIVDVKKVIKRGSFLSRMVYYDYVNMNLANLLFSRFVGKCAALNGAVFAVRREALEKLGGFNHVICEDLDIGIRAYLAGLSFKFLRNVEVEVIPPSSWRSWLKQRKRWAVGAGVWLSMYWKSLVKILLTKPQAALPAILTIFPSLLTLASSLFMGEGLIRKTLFLVALYFASILPSLMTLFTLVSYSLAFLPVRALAVSLASFTGYLIIYLYASRKLGHGFYFLDFIVYYFIYSPIWLIILLAGLFRVLVLKKTEVEDWIV